MTADERQAVDLLYAAFAGAIVEAEVMTFVHPGPPVAWERTGYNPRSKSFYTKAATRKAEEAIAWRWRGAAKGRKPYLDTMAVATIFFMPTAAWTRGDGDNLQKLILDAGNHARIWGDDRQVKAGIWLIDIDVEHPRTVVAASPYRSVFTKAPLLMGIERT